MVVSLVMPVVYALQAASPAAFVSIAAVGLAVVAAALASGGIVGFIFGIPRLLQDARAVPQSTAADGSSIVESDSDRTAAAPYGGNTSLEQISDWLTKILVGVGLTQLANLPTALTGMGTFLAPGLGGLPGADIFAIGVVVFAVLIGFFLCYLWTRLNLPSLLVESDTRARIASAEQRGEKRALRATNTAAAVGREARETREASGAPRVIYGLWVDDRPEHNINERQTLEETLGVQFVTVTATDEALEELTANPGKYELVITDQSRPGDRQAGFTLLREMRTRGINAPVVMYSADSSPEFDREARRRGAVGATHSPSSLLRKVSRIVEGKGSLLDGAG